MTALRVLTEHQEFENSGNVTHAQLDNYVNNAAWVIVSGAAGPIPPSARRIRAGTGISVIDNGPGGELIVQAATVTTGSQISWSETPSGIRDGSNKTFTLAFTPTPGAALMFFSNGILQKQASDSDYVLSGNTITMVWAPISGSNLLATYPF